MSGKSAILGRVGLISALSVIVLAGGPPAARKVAGSEALPPNCFSCEYLGAGTHRCKSSSSGDWQGGLYHTDQAWNSCTEGGETFVTHQECGGHSQPCEGPQYQLVELANHLLEFMNNGDTARLTDLVRANRGVLELNALRGSIQALTAGGCAPTVEVVADIPITQRYYELLSPPNSVDNRPVP